MSSLNTFFIGDPRLDWSEDEQPFSAKFGDVYFSTFGGLEESTYVFINGIDAPKCWEDKDSFVIGEIGFGVGLNFLNTWHQWRSTAPKHSQLYYVSIEGYPVQKEDIVRAIARFPVLQNGMLELTQKLPPIHHGFHSIHLDQNRVHLLLILGPVQAMLSSLIANIDAWYLDGFAPKKNPVMWSSQVIKEIARLSHAGTKFSTFTASGAVRRDLESFGFKVDKRPGFGNKRECLYGAFSGNTSDTGLLPYFELMPPLSRFSRVAIIGGGIAGAALAKALKGKCSKLTIYEQNKGEALEASGNPLALVQPKLSDPRVCFSRFQTDAYLKAIRNFEEIEGAFVGERGMISFGRDNYFLDRSIKWVEERILPKEFALRLDASDINDISGVNINSEGIFHSQGGSINPKIVCKELLSSTECRFNVRVADLRQEEGEWLLLSKNNIELGRADAVILANGINICESNKWSESHISAKRGQISFVRPTEASYALKRPISYGGYATPILKRNSGAFHILGSTYDEAQLHKESWRKIKRASGVKNLGLLSKREIGLETIFGKNIIGGRSAIRSTTSDRFPIVGSLFSDHQFRIAYDGVQYGKKNNFYKKASTINRLKGIFVFGGFGSNGFTLAMHTAELLVAQMFGHPVPADRRIIEGSNPSRFIIRKMKRQN